MILFIDAERIYHFRIGDNVKVGETFYHIYNIEPMQHKEATGSITAGTSTTVKNFNTAGQSLSPTDQYVYFFEHIGIDGLCEFKFELPKGQGHLTPHGHDEFIDFDRANKLDPMYLPFIVMNPEYPSVKLNNPAGVDNNSDMYLWGYKWHIKKALDMEPAKYIELIDYARSGYMGTA